MPALCSYFQRGKLRWWERGREIGGSLWRAREGVLLPVLWALSRLWSYRICSYSVKEFSHVSVRKHDKIANPAKVKGALLSLLGWRVGDSETGTWSMEKNMLGTTVEAISASSQQPWLWLAGLQWGVSGESVTGKPCSGLNGKHLCSKSWMSKICMTGLAVLASPTSSMRNSPMRNQREAPIPLCVIHIGCICLALGCYREGDTPRGHCFSGMENPNNCITEAGCRI